MEKEEALHKKDPSNLVLLERDDFTNFTVFYDNYKGNSEIIEKLLSYSNNKNLILQLGKYHNRLLTRRQHSLK